MEIPLIDYTNLVGTTYGTTVTTAVHQPTRKCFKFKTMRGNSETVIVDRKEFEAFLKFVGAEQTEKPCDSEW